LFVFNYLKQTNTMQTRSQTKLASANIPSKKTVEYKPQEIRSVEEYWRGRMFASRTEVPRLYSGPSGEEYAVEIDFDEASRHWNANKKRLTNGCYQYVCGALLSNGLFCKRKMCKTSQLCSQCTKKKE
jgi:hypothetical protein